MSFRLAGLTVYVPVAAYRLYPSSEGPASNRVCHIGTAGSYSAWEPAFGGNLLSCEARDKEKEKERALHDTS